MKKLLTVLAAACLALSAWAAQPPSGRNSFRIGWGDMLFETLAFSDSYAGVWPSPETLPASFTRDENFDHRYTGHIFAEYGHSFSELVSVGFLADLEGIFWKTGSFDRYHQLTEAATTVRNWDLVLMPTVRFTYFRRPLVRLYSGVGAGVLFAFDNAGGFRAAPAFNLNALGAEVGRGHWGATAELGMMNALTKSDVYQLGSRLFSVSIYYKW